MKKMFLCLLLASFSFCNVLVAKTVTFDINDFMSIINDNPFSSSSATFTKENCPIILTLSGDCEDEGPCTLGIDNEGTLYLYSFDETSRIIVSSSSNQFYISKIEYKWLDPEYSATKACDGYKNDPILEGYNDVLSAGSNISVFSTSSKDKSSVALEFSVDFWTQLESVTVTYDEKIYDSVDLIDGTPYSYSYAGFKANSATYTRTMGTQWGSLCLPFDIDYDEEANYDLYTLSAEQEEGIISLTKIESTLAAGTPVIIRRNSGDDNKEVTLVGAKAEGKDYVQGCATPLSSTSGSMTLYGTFTGHDIQATENAYFVAADKFWNSYGDPVYISPYRAWVEDASSDSRYRSLDLSVQTVEASAISAIEMLNDNDARYYDASGCTQSGLKPGLNIVKTTNGVKKIYVK